MNIQQNNMNQFSLHFILTLLLSSLALNVFAQDFVYVNSKTAKVFASADFNSPVITKLERSDKLDVLSKKGIWVQVKHQQVSGWVIRYLVTETPPITKKISFFNRIKNFFNPNKRRDRTSVVSTAGGVRGLSDGEVSSTGNRDVESLETLEEVKISPQELEEFIQSNEK